MEKGTPPPPHPSAVTVPAREIKKEKRIDEDSTLALTAEESPMDVEAVDKLSYRLS
jgi:hypothetical protein